MASSDGKDLRDLSVSELRDLAAKHDITGRSTMRKGELLQAVEDAEEQTSRMESSSAGASASSSESSDSDTDSSSDSKPWRSSGGGDEDSDDPSNDAEGITAPSIGPNTVIEHVPPEERLDQDKISDVDAMGLDKRRQVRGQRYGASPAKQAVVYGVFIAVVAALAFGGKVLAEKADEPPETIVQEAPWTGSDKEPAPIDFAPTAKDSSGSTQDD